MWRVIQVPCSSDVGISDVLVLVPFISRGLFTYAVKAEWWLAILLLSAGLWRTGCHWRRRCWAKSSSYIGRSWLYKTHDGASNEKLFWWLANESFTGKVCISCSHGVSRVLFTCTGIMLLSIFVNCLGITVHLVQLCTHVLRTTVLFYSVSVDCLIFHHIFRVIVLSNSNEFWWWYFFSD